jgi:hypothetical protein
MAKARMKSFQYWSEQDVRMLFGLKKQSTNPALDNLLTVKNDLTAHELQLLDKYRARLLKMANAWNEEDLKMYFISQIIELTDIGTDDENYRFFFDYLIKGKVNDEIIGGKVDALLATGYQTPIAPFFFLKEYKAEKKRETDPLGQLLAAMVVAQQHNDSQELIYGSYVLGRFWIFLVFEGNEYTISPAYDMTQTDVYEVVLILRKIKELFKKKLNLI